MFKRNIESIQAVLAVVVSILTMVLDICSKFDSKKIEIERSKAYHDGWEVGYKTVEHEKLMFQKLYYEKNGWTDLANDIQKQIDEF